jgi:peptidoglycan-associated lipoprotein
MIKHWSLSLVLVAALAGCASGVKLDNVPVEDKNATAAPAADAASSANANANANASGVNPNASQAQGSRSAVAPVTAQATPKGIGPAGVPHVVYFDYDSFLVRADALPIIQNHARFLQSNRQRKLMLEGHTDERGGREYNLALGQKRAEAVRKALNQLGVDDQQIEAISYGKEKPAVEGSDESAWAKNRRVELRY